MTEATSYAPLSYVGNGTTTVFNAPSVSSQTELVVVLVSADGTRATQNIGAQYTYSSGTGQITMLTAPAVGQTLVVARDTPLTQVLDLQPLQQLPAESLEAAYDKLTRIAQELDSAGLRLPPGFDQPDIQPAENTFLTFGSNGYVIATTTVADIVAAAAAVADPPSTGSVSYETRAAFVAAVAGGYEPAAGTVVFANGYGYIRDAADTGISDLEGWSPLGPTTPWHFESEVVSGDWSAAFDAAMVYSKSVHVPAGNYTIKSQMAFQQEGQVLYGPSPRPNAVQSAAGAKLVYDAALGSTPLLHMQFSGQIANLAFDGPGKGTGVAIIARKPTDYGAAYEDTDVEITECSIDGWHTAIQHWNRGLRFKNNNISLCTRAVELEGFDAANFVDDTGNPFDALNEGFRSIIVNGNRMHAVDLVVRNFGLNAGSLRGFELCDNIMDIGDALFDGGLKSGRISNNTVDQTSAAYVIRTTTQVDEIVISGNNFRGDLVQGIPARFIEFADGCNRLTMTGNALRGASKFGVYLSAGVLSGLITGNVIDLENDGDSTDACIRADTGADFTNLAITGNYLNAASGTPLIRGSASSNFIGVVIEGNAGNRSRTLVSNFVDGGGNLTQSW